jgi:hypothetical protein
VFRAGGRTVGKPERGGLSVSFAQRSRPLPAPSNSHFNLLDTINWKLFDNV